MAAILSTARRAPDPTRLEIELRKAEILARQQAVVDELLAEHSMLMADCYDEARITGADPFRLLIETNAELHQRDETEPLDLVDHWNNLPVANCEVFVQRIFVEKPNPEPREMTKADICNIDIASLRLLNLIPDCDEERWTAGDVNPETEDVSDAATYERMVANAKPIAFQLKTEAVPPFKSATAFAKPKRLPRVVTDVRAFRSKRR